MKEKSYPISTTFDIKGANVNVTGFEPDGNPYVPKLLPHVFDRSMMRSFVAWYMNPRDDGFCFWGPKGSGKTSFVRQFAARLQIPLYEVSCKLRTEFKDWVGGFRLEKAKGDTAPTTRYAYGPLAMAMRHGGIFLVDEPDIMDPSELTGMNPILDGGSLLIEENDGELIHPHPWFRVVFGANTDLGGDKDGEYLGTLVQNESVRDRLRFHKVDYLDLDTEIQILRTQVPKLPKQLMKPMVEVAQAIRKQFTGGNNAQTRLPFSMSTRTLLRWAHLLFDFNGAKRPLEFALEETLFGRNITKEHRDAVITICKAKFGDLWDMVVSSDKADAGKGKAAAKA